MDLLTRRQFAVSAARTAVGGLAIGSTVALTGCPTVAQWENIVIADLPAILQVISEIFVIAKAPSVSAVLESNIQNITRQVTADLDLINTLVANYKAHASPGLLTEIDAALMDAQTNLSALLAAFHVSDPILMATIAAAIGVAISAVAGLETIIPPPPKPSPTRLFVAYDMGGNAIRHAFNTIVGPNYPNNILR